MCKLPVSLYRKILLPAFPAAMGGIGSSLPSGIQKIMAAPNPIIFSTDRLIVYASFAASSIHLALPQYFKFNHLASPVKIRLGCIFMDGKKERKT